MAGVMKLFRSARQTFRSTQCGCRIFVSNFLIFEWQSSNLSTLSSSQHQTKLSKMTGLSKQYFLIKQKFPNYIVLFQVGDFYEIYNDDARKVAEKTQLRLARNSNMNSLMAGFPARALDTWQTTLVQQGFQLAICAQIPEKTQKSSRLLHREVVRLVTPGTLLEPLQAEANYLLSVIRGHSNSVGLAWLDLSTGDFQLCVSSLDSLAEDLSRINPAEVLVCKENLNEKHHKASYKFGNQREWSPLACLHGFHLTVIPSEWFHFNENEQSLGQNFEYFKDLNLTEFSSIEISAAAGLLKFVSYTQKDVSPLINAPTKFSQQTHMAIDPNTRQSLELTKPLLGNEKKATLLGVLDNTTSAAGKRLLHSRICAPSTVVNVINKRLDAVEFFFGKHNLAENLQKALKYCPDIERKLQKVATGLAGLSDLRAILNSIILYENVLDLLSSNLSSEIHNVEAVSSLLINDFESLENLKDELNRSVGELTSEYSMMEGYSDNADDVQKRIDENGEKVQQLRESYRSTLQIRGLTINSHKSFIRVIEVPSTRESQMATNEDFVRVDSTSGKIRYSTLRLQELNAELKALEEERDRIQKTLSAELCQKVASYDLVLKRMALSLAELDVASSLALLAFYRGFIRPTMVEGTKFEVTGGRHPVVDIMQPDSFVNNDCNLTEKHVWIVTGPNMGGKSTFLRQNALLAIMAQAGSFIPAHSACIGVVDRIFARIGASDNLVQHQSTFMSEMLETAYILSHATQRSLVVVDEIGRGTSTFDGLSIAWAVIEHLHSAVRCRTLTSTHFHYLSSMSRYLPHVHSCHVTASSTDEGISFTFKVMPGCDEKSFGIDVAKLAGIPVAVEQRARDILSQLEQDKSVFSGSNQDSQEMLSERNKGATKITTEKDNLIKLNGELKQKFLNPLLSIDPNSLTPKQALEVVYRLHNKAKSCV